jgi:hypothetical protein
MVRAVYRRGNSMLTRTSDGGSAANAGLVDGNTGKCEPTVDALPLEVHMGIAELLEAAARGVAASVSISNQRRDTYDAA